MSTSEDSSLDKVTKYAEQCLLRGRHSQSDSKNKMSKENEGPSQSEIGTINQEKLEIII